MSNFIKLYLSRKELAILFATIPMKRHFTLPIVLLTCLLTFSINASTLPVLVENNTTLVPLRFLSETLGYNVNFTNDTHPIIVTNGSSTLKFSVGSDQLNVNGKLISLPLTIKKVNGTTMVPLRIFSENLGTTTLFEDNVLYLSNDTHYWIWEIDNGKNTLKSLTPQKFFPNNSLTISDQFTANRLLNLTPTVLKKYFPGALKIPGTSNYIAYLNPNTPSESTLTFHYDLNTSLKPYCITLGQAPQKGVNIFGFNYTDAFTPLDLKTKLGTPVATYKISDTSTSYLVPVANHYLNCTFIDSPSLIKQSSLYYIDLYASSYFND